ncbi:MAG: hypothetical protein ACI4JW_07715 [Oscillospiraceae bacterium]
MKKESILKELDLYNINEATLFPELEHQLNYIRYINKEHVQAVSVFLKYDEKGEANKQSINLDEEKFNSYLGNNLSNILNNVVSSKDLEEIKNIILNCMTIDWYKRDNALSKIKMAITGYYYTKTQDKKASKEKATQILDKLNEEVKKYNTSDIEKR